MIIKSWKDRSLEQIDPGRINPGRIDPGRIDARRIRCEKELNKLNL